MSPGADPVKSWKGRADGLEAYMLAVCCAGWTGRSRFLVPGQYPRIAFQYPAEPSRPLMRRAVAGGVDGPAFDRVGHGTYLITEGARTP